MDGELRTQPSKAESKSETRDGEDNSEPEDIRVGKDDGIELGGESYTKKELTLHGGSCSSAGMLNYSVN